MSLNSSLNQNAQQTGRYPLCDMTIDVQKNIFANLKNIIDNLIELYNSLN